MSDMANLFKISSLTSRNNSYLSRFKPNPSNKPEEWNIAKIQAQMRKGVKKEVVAQSMSEELKIFFKMQKQVSLSRLLLITCVTLGLCFLSDIEGSILFSIFLFVGTEILTTTILHFSDPTLIANIRRVQPLLYTAVFYSLLKWQVGLGRNQISWEITTISIFASLSHYTLRAYQGILTLSSRQLIGKVTKQKNPIKKWFYFPQYLYERISMVINISRYSFLIVVVLSSFLLATLIYFNKFTMQIFKPAYLLVSIPIFICFEAYIDFLDFTQFSSSHNLKFSRTVKDKIPVFLKLLRLQGKPFNRQVQTECIKYIVVKVSQIQNYLSTQTCKSLIYNTYMDIFNQYAVTELERVNSIIFEYLRRAKLNDKVITKEKSLIQDLMIYFKKLNAFVQSEWEALTILQELSSLNFMVLLISEVNKSDEQIKISSRVMTLTKGIINQICQCSQRISLSSYTTRQFQNIYNNINSGLNHPNS